MKENTTIELLDKFASHNITDSEQLMLDKLMTTDKLLDKMILEGLNDERKIEGADAAKSRIFGKVNEQIGNRRKAVRLKSFDKFIRVAAVVAIIIAAGSLLVVPTQYSATIEKNDLCIEVLKGQKSNLKLPDGTQVFLNSDSKLSFGKRFNSSERVVELTGEAYFEVAPDSQRPFTVLANEIAVTALGTEFSVRNYEDQYIVDIFLAKGSVRVDAPQQELTMIPGQLVIYSKKTNTLNINNDIDQRKYLCWMNGMLYIDDQTFEEVAKTLERTYNVQIEFANNSLKTHRFSGWVNNNSLESTLHILGLTTQFSYKYADGVLVLE